MDVILGLDVSTSIIGWCVLRCDAKLGDKPVMMGHIDLRKLNGFWNKVDFVRKRLSDLIRDIKEPEFPKGSMFEGEEACDMSLDRLLEDEVTSSDVEWNNRILGIYIENPVKRFRAGMSSANTIGLLAKFNIMVSYFVRYFLGIEPLYIGATQARKQIGIILTSKKKAGGLNEKEQTFKQLNETVFKDEKWPLNRNQKIQPYCFDQVDAYVIAMAGTQGVGEPA